MPVEQIRDLTQKLEFAAGLQEAQRKAGQGVGQRAEKMS
mgnify:FL=1